MKTILILLLISSIANAQTHYKLPRNAVMRDGNKPSSKVVSKLHAGDVINLVKYDPLYGYIQVEANGRVGYINEVYFVPDDRYIQAFKQTAIKPDKPLRIGMTKAEVIDAIGNPDDVNRDIYKDYIKEQWIYDKKSKYLYFEDNTLTAIQER